MEQNALKNLVMAAQAGEPDSVEKLFEASYQDVYYFILKTVKETELAEDLTQDTFLRILENLRELKAPEAFVSWSRQIAYRCCTDYFRKRKELLLDEYEEGQSPFDLIPEEDAEFIPHEALDREDLKNTLLKMLDTLPQEQRSAMVLRYYDELSVAQIAQVQNVSEGTVKSRLNYGRKALAKCVDDYEKKNGIKLHSVAVLPLLLWLFRKQKLAAGVSVSKAAVSAGATASGVASGTAAAAAKAAAAAGTKLALGVKIALAATAAVAVIAGAALGISGLSKKSSPAKETEHPSEPNSVIIEDTTDADYIQDDIWVTVSDALTYIKDQQIYYISESGPVQLTSNRIELGGAQPKIYFSDNMRYVCYPDSPAEVGEISYQYYYKDLEDPAFAPIPLDGFITMSADGQRILLFEVDGRNYTQILLDVPSGQKYNIYTGDIGIVAGIYLHDENLTTMITIDRGPLDEPYEYPSLYVWQDGQSRLISNCCQDIKTPYRDSSDHYDYCFDNRCPDCYCPDNFYYLESSGNLYRFDMNTLESNLCASNVMGINSMEKDGSLIFYRYNPKFPQGYTQITHHSVLESLIEYDSYTELDWSGNICAELLEAYDYFQYQDGAETCIVQNASAYWAKYDCAVYTYLQPEKVTPVKPSEYGQETLKEVERRLLETAVLQVKSGTDTIEFQDLRYFESSYSHISIEEDITGAITTVCCWVCTNDSQSKNREQTFTVYEATVTDGVFGPVSSLEITETRGGKQPNPHEKPTQEYPVKLAWADDHNYLAQTDDDMIELYIDGDKVLTGTDKFGYLSDGIFWCTEFDSETGRGIYYVVALYADGTVCEIARDAYIDQCICVGDELYAIIADHAEAEKGDLCLWQDGEWKLVEADIDNIAPPNAGLTQESWF